MAKTNKFNIHWQIVRTNARDIKDVDKKIQYVIRFLNANKNIHNYERVMNWLKMTAVAYKGSQREKFIDVIEDIESQSSKYTNTKDMDNDFSKVPREDVEKVFKDLSKRKYGFQYKTAPKAHNDFMASLKDYLKN